MRLRRIRWKESALLSDVTEAETILTIKRIKHRTNLKVFADDLWVTTILKD